MARPAGIFNNMKIHLIAIGTRMPVWVRAGYAEYAKRVTGICRLDLIEVAAAKRGKNADIARATQDEGERMLRAVPSDCRIVALERSGRRKNTLQLADALRGWLNDGRDVAFLVGGPEGLSTACLRRAHETWSLSELTLAHPLVRVVLAEQIYRAWSIVNNLPYHRD